MNLVSLRHGMRPSKGRVEKRIFISGCKLRWKYNNRMLRLSAGEVAHRVIVPPGSGRTPGRDRVAAG